MLHPTVFNTAHICYQLGVEHAVLSPGSRNAPLTISFARHQAIKKYIIPDERTAGFVALGISQEIRKPVVLVCTSGTALLNYGPAMAEAFYRQIPLIVLSADRPPDLIDQRDGQTIRQFEALSNHVKRSIQAPIVTDTIRAKEYEQLLIGAIQEAEDVPSGPVHLNVPFQEPFYPDHSQDLSFKDVQITSPSIEKPPIEAIEMDDSGRPLKVLCLVGQVDHAPSYAKALKESSKHFPVIKAPLNNLVAGIEHVDGFIADRFTLKPDLLITSGLSVLSKSLKHFIRKHPPEQHFHFDEAGIEVDTYQTSPTLVKAPIEPFLSRLSALNIDPSFIAEWSLLATKASEVIDDTMHQAPFSEAKASWIVFNAMPPETILHLANSMPVRYADLFGTTERVVTRSNRGTSGIDGCTSTAVGNALISDYRNVLVTGDLAFLYDRNAFFHNYAIPNLRVIIMNNAGGGIFRLIDGPSGLPELEDYFETRHNRTAEYICKENGLGYLKIYDEKSLRNEWTSFMEPAQTAKVMEIFTDPTVNQKVYKQLRNNLKTYVKD